MFYPFLIALLLSSSLLFSDPIQPRSIPPKALQELTTYLHIPEDADLIEETQKRWLRKPTQERWEMQELSAEEREYVLSWGERIGLFSDWLPAETHYDQALILGATTERMEMRLNYLKKLWEEGTRFDQIVWLTGERPLDPRVDAKSDVCKTETEVARLLWQEADLPLEMKALLCTFIAVPMKGEAPHLKRPNTEDTLIAWLETGVKSCSALFVSDQPFCGYQYAVIEKALPPTLSFDVVGAGVDPRGHPAAAAITLDSIARWLYAAASSIDKPK